MSYRLRAQQIIIDIPRTSSEPWINIRVQKVELDTNGHDIQVIDRWGSINKKLSDVALEVSKYFEVLPVGAGEISVFGISDGIKDTAVRWIKEKYGGELNENGDVIVSNK